MSTSGRTDNTFQTPFIELTAGPRMAMIAYFFLYSAFFPYIAILGDEESQHFLYLRFLVRLIYIFLSCYPLIFYRKEYGILHPLILPAFIMMAKNIAMNPLHLIFPLVFNMFDFYVPTYSAAYSLMVSNEDLALIRCEYEALLCVSLIAYYAGYFFISQKRGKNLNLSYPKYISLACLCTIGVCVLISFAFIFSRGGLSSYIVSLRLGRSNVLAGSGHFLVIGKAGLLISLLWFAYLKRPFSSIFWIGCFAASAFTSLILTGSRSTVIFSLIVLVLLWWKKNNKIRIGVTIGVGIISFAVFAVFGAIRQDYGSDSINVNISESGAIAGFIERAQAELEKRGNEEGDIAVFAGASQGLLWGRSYLAAASFWIPRAIWANKPHGAGAYNMWVNYAGGTLDNFGDGTYWGIPTSAEAEAYWNFHIPGVLIVFALLGSFHRYLANLVVANPNTPIILFLCVWITIFFRGDPNSFVNTSREVLIILVVGALAGIRFLKPGSVTGGSLRAPGALYPRG